MADLQQSIQRSDSLEKDDLAYEENVTPKLHIMSPAERQAALAEAVKADPGPAPYSVNALQVCCTLASNFLLMLTDHDWTLILVVPHRARRLLLLW